MRNRSGIIVAIFFVIIAIYFMMPAHKPQVSWTYDLTGKTLFAHLQSAEVPVSDKDLQKNSGALFGKIYLYRFVVDEYIDLEEYLRLHPNDDGRRYQDKYIIVSDSLPDGKFFEYDESVVSRRCGVTDVRLSCERR